MLYLDDISFQKIKSLRPTTKSQGWKLKTLTGDLRLQTNNGTILLQKGTELSFSAAGSKTLLFIADYRHNGQLCQLTIRANGGLIFRPYPNGALGGNSKTLISFI